MRKHLALYFVLVVVGNLVLQATAFTRQAPQQPDVKSAPTTDHSYVVHQAVYEATVKAAYEAKAEAEWCVYLTDQELRLAERLVEAEAGNQPYAGQMAVAQCVLDRMHAYDMSLTDVVTAPRQFAQPVDYEPSDSVKEAVYAVFHDGVRVSTEPILFFYSTVGGFVSAEHEGRNYLVTIDDHKFFN